MCLYRLSLLGKNGCRSLAFKNTKRLFYHKQNISNTLNIHFYIYPGHIKDKQTTINVKKYYKCINIEKKTQFLVLGKIV